VPELITLTEGKRWRIGATEFEWNFSDQSTVQRFSLRKPPELVAKYDDLCHEYRGSNIVELGIAAGGSTAFLALLAQPRRLVACELESKRVAALDELIAAEDLGEVVHPYFGVDQSDRARLTAILDDEFDDEPLDLVIDDASHLYDETIASFEVLYPRVRPGGLFIIEDWASDHARAKWVRDALAAVDAPGHAEVVARVEAARESRAKGLGPFPLHRLAPELMELAFPAAEVVAGIAVDRDWIAVRRGPAVLDRDTFRLADVRSGDWEWVLP
jgi:predicted O-methyltransferase YrrM